jgi:6-pyruvoyltetrahydropterin/6-carboxytetrahydropterin synthase
MIGQNMYTVSKTFSFCYGHRLLNDDGRCQHLHGHTARATLAFGSVDLDSKGMVCHFDRLKETMGKWIDENFDHTLLLSEDDPLAALLRGEGEKLKTLPVNPTAEMLAKTLFDVAAEFTLPIVSVDVWESETSRATYSPNT